MAKKDKPEKGKKKRDQEAVADGTLSSTLIQTARAMRTLLARDLVDQGLYAGQEMVILSLAEADGKSPGVIAAELGVRAPTITKTVNRLMAQGFVEKRGNGSDGRRTEIALTTRGHETLASIKHATASVEQALLSGLSGKETRQLARLLKKLEENLSENSALQS